MHAEVVKAGLGCDPVPSFLPHGKAGSSGENLASFAGMFLETSTGLLPIFLAWLSVCLDILLDLEQR